VEAAEFLESRTLSQDSIPGTTLKQHLDDLYKDGEKHDVVIGRAMLALEKEYILPKRYYSLFYIIFI
jgi:hypothetical protein